MRTLSGILTTTRVDRHGHRMTLSSLEDGAGQINRLYLPFGVEHDPRIAPIGRVVAARVVPVGDGEYGLEGEIEIFEPGDDLPLPDEGREIPMREYPSTQLQVLSDMAFEDADSRRDLAELSERLGSDHAQEMKKAFEPIAVLVIGGAAFVLGQLAQGFLSRLGEDGYELLKTKLKALVGRRQAIGKDTLLEVSLVVPLQGQNVEIDIHCTNPTGIAIDDIVRKQLQRIDDALPSLVDPRLGIRRLVFEYQEGDVHLRFAVRRDAVPLFPKFDPVDQDRTDEPG
jgi:hypothetical protein